MAINIGPRLVASLRSLHDRLKSGKGVSGYKRSSFTTCGLCLGNGKQPGKHAPCKECDGHGVIRLVYEADEID